MSREPFSSRSTGVLFWGACYLVTAIAGGLVLAALWPQGSVCTTSCGERLEAGATAMALLAVGGLLGLGVAIWLGTTRRATAPRRLTLLLLVLLLAALATAVLLGRSGGADSDAAGLATVRSAWSWALAVPTAALLASSLAAGLRVGLRGRRTRPVASARVRRA